MYKPRPLFVLDEIDAALDNRNVGIVARFIKSIRSAQYLVISHRNQMQKEANVLMLVRKDDEGQSSVLRFNV